MPEKYRPQGSEVEYVVPSLDEPADGPQAFRDFADSIPTALSPAIPVYRKDSNYVLTAADNGGLVEMDTTNGDLTVTVPLTGPAFDVPVGATITVANWGKTRKKVVKLQAQSGVTVRDLAVRTINLWRMVTLLQVEKDSWIINAGQGNDDVETVPGPPLNLKADVNAQKVVTLTWDAPEDDGGTPITSYLIDTSLDNKAWVTRGYAEAPQQGTGLVGLPTGKVWLRAVACNKWGPSKPTSPVEVTVP